MVVVRPCTRYATTASSCKSLVTERRCLSTEVNNCLVSFIFVCELRCHDGDDKRKWLAWKAWRSTFLVFGFAVNEESSPSQFKRCQHCIRMTWWLNMRLRCLNKEFWSKVGEFNFVVFVNFVQAIQRTPFSKVEEKKSHFLVTILFSSCLEVSCVYPSIGTYASE